MSVVSLFSDLRFVSVTGVLYSNIMSYSSALSRHLTVLPSTGTPKKWPLCCSAPCYEYHAASHLVFKSKPFQPIAEMD